MQGGIEIAGLSPIVIPVFISHLGCPHRCVFCDQRQFSETITPERVEAEVETFIGLCSRPDQRKRCLAFFGGSFTGIKESLFEKYLKVASSLVAKGIVHGVKASTRPDMISPEILDRLVDSGFVEIELGAQSMDDKVLEMSRRGHTRLDTIRASEMISSSGLRLGIQIMPGLPLEDRQSFRETINAITALKPDTARIYPTVVLAGTGLEGLYNQGQYTPLELDEAVSRSLFAYLRLKETGCTILRIGIPPSDGLKIIAGPYHDSIGYLVKSKAYWIMARRMVDVCGPGAELRVHPRDLQELIGYKRRNIKDISFSYSFDETLPRGYVKAFGPRESACVQLNDIIGYIL